MIVDFRERGRGRERKRNADGREKHRLNPQPSGAQDGAPTQQDARPGCLPNVSKGPVQRCGALTASPFAFELFSLQN